jgi:hypothetical protein
MSERVRRGARGDTLREFWTRQVVGVGVCVETKSRVDK